MNSYINRLLFICTAIFMPLIQMQAVWQLPPTQFPAVGNGIDMGSDANGNAIVVLQDNTDNTIQAFYYSRATNLWTDPTILGTSNGILSLDVDASGTALAVWVDPDDISIRSAFFNGTSWTLGIPDPIATASGINVSGIALSMNGPNSALLTWFDDDGSTETYNSNFYSSGSWGPTILITTPAFNTFSGVQYSANGTAVTSFGIGTLPLQAFNFIGGSWQGPTILDPSLPLANHNSVTAIDAQGRALAVWVNTAGNVQSRTFDGTTWLPAVTISNTPGNNPRSTSISMAPNGTAVAAWVDGASVGYSSSYNGTTWSTPQQFANPVDPNVASDISVNTSGEALLLFQRPGPASGQGTILSARLPLNGVWTSPQFLFTPDAADNDTVNPLIASLSDNGFGFAAWGSGGEGFEYFAAVEIILFPPATINGRACSSRFASQSVNNNIIEWTPSPSPNVVSYEIRRNGILVATIPAAGPLIYVDENVCRNIYTYTITVVDANGNVSVPRNVVLR